MVSDTGGVNEAERDAGENKGVFYGVAGGTGNRRDNGTLFAQQQIQEGGLAGVRSTDDSYRDTVLDGIAGGKGGGEPGELRLDGRGELVEVGAVSKGDIFLAEIKLKFDEGGDLQ
jgi:hypothetical protein